jgi:hypothetical protein
MCGQVRNSRCQLEALCKDLRPSAILYAFGHLSFSVSPALSRLAVAGFGQKCRAFLPSPRFGTPLPRPAVRRNGIAYVCDTHAPLSALHITYQYFTEIELIYANMASALPLR